MKKILTLISFSLLLVSCEMTRPYAATNNPIGSKTGVSKTVMLFGRPAGNSLASFALVLNKDFGVIDAAKNGKINKIATVDIKYKGFILFGKTEIIVTGE